VRALRVAVVAPLMVMLALSACGEETEPIDDTQPAPTFGEGGVVDDTPADEADPSGLSLDLAFDEPLSSGQPVTWELSVTNIGAEDVVLTFADAQQGDVVLSDEGGEEVYRWSEDQMFTQALRCQTIDVGQAGRYQLQGQLDVEPGEYEVTATLNAQPEPVAYTETIVVEPQPGDGGG
jgi:hypothetical protein